MALLSTKNSVSVIERKSSSTLDVFNKTLNELNSLNTQIDSETEAKLAEVERLTAEANYLKGLKDKHNKVINKINKIFED